MVKLGIADPSSSAWIVILTFCAKKAKKSDYYRHEDADLYPVRHIHDFAQSLRGRKLFLPIDLIRAFHQILVAEEDISKMDKCIFRAV